MASVEAVEGEAIVRENCGDDQGKRRRMSATPSMLQASPTF